MSTQRERIHKEREGEDGHLYTMGEMHPLSLALTVTLVNLEIFLDYFTKTFRPRFQGKAQVLTLQCIPQHFSLRKGEGSLESDSPEPVKTSPLETVKHFHEHHTITFAFSVYSV